MVEPLDNLSEHMHALNDVNGCEWHEQSIPSPYCTQTSVVVTCCQYHSNVSAEARECNFSGVDQHIILTAKSRRRTSPQCLGVVFKANIWTWCLPT